MFVEEKTQGEVAPAKVERIRLSTAIRIGAAKRPQCYGTEWEDGKSCAMAAASEGLGGSYGRFLSMTWARTTFPDVPGAVIYGVATKNDRHETREEIADWLESQGY